MNINGNISINTQAAQQAAPSNKLEKAVKKAEWEIMELSGSVHNLEDMIAVDELVQELLSKRGLTL